MKVVILCGGQGTRIRDANEALPKPMLPIGNRPIVWHIMKGYAQHGLNEFILCLGHKGWTIKEFFLNYRSMTADVTVHLGTVKEVEYHQRQSDEDWRVTLAETGESTMTGGRVAAIRKYVEKDELFLLTYGDGVSDVDISKLVAFHRAHGKIGTVTAVRPPGRFGEMRTCDGIVEEFNEKPQTSEGFINGGFFVFDSKKLWSYLSGGSSEIFERDPLQKLAKAGELAAFSHQGFWQPMDTYREYALLNELWSSQRAPWKTWTERSE